MQFSAKILPNNNFLLQMGELVPLVWEILDPPLINPTPNRLWSATAHLPLQPDGSVRSCLSRWCWRELLVLSASLSCRGDRLYRPNEAAWNHSHQNKQPTYVGKKSNRNLIYEQKEVKYVCSICLTHALRKVPFTNGTRNCLGVHYYYYHR